MSASSARPYRHLCPEADMRDAMTDDEFWAHVYPSTECEYDPTAEPLDVSIAQDVCGDCGSVGACAWDAEGRPLIHATSDGRDDE